MKNQTKLLFLAVLLIGGVARGETDTRFTFAGGGGFWLYPQAGGHGIGLVRFDALGLIGDANLGIELNTDTLRLSLDRIRLAGGIVEFGFNLTGEGGFAGLLPDYYRDGELDEERGFWASYFGGGGFAKVNLPASNYLSLSLGVRKWIFAKNKETADSFVLPLNAWVFEPRLNYTFWRIQSTPSLYEKHRLFPRIHGFALGITAGMDVRSGSRPWGAVDPAHFDPADSRNDPENLVFLGHQWVRAGYQFQSRIRTQFHQTSVLGHGGDDLTRTRVGGLNPYVVPVAGLPWAAHLSEDLVALSWSWHFRAGDHLETGVMFDGALVSDVHRTGRTDDFDPLAGVGLFLDWPIGRWQIDARVGWALPMSYVPAPGGFAGFVSFGSTS